MAITPAIRCTFGLGACLLASLAIPAAKARFTLDGHTFTLPDGFEIELVAGPPLVDRPIAADFDEQGRLYVADSSGSNDKVDEAARRRSRTASSGSRTPTATAASTSSTVFADKMMFPEGTMWLDGSLYVAAPPSIWKLTDTDGDGVADQRERVVPGQDADRLRQRPARPVPRPRRLDLLVQGGVRRADLRAARQAAVRHAGRRTSSAAGPTAPASSR